VSFYGTVRALFHPFGRWYFRMQVEGLEHIPAEGSAILAANHVSWLDPAVLGSACPRPIRFLISRSVHEIRVTRWFYAGMRTIPVERGTRESRWLRAALRALARGEVVGIFPEGEGLAPGGDERDPMPGALLIGALSGAPLIPVGLSGTYSALPPGRRVPRPGRVTVRFGEPYRPWPAGERPGRGEVRSAVAELMSRVRALQAGAPS
jgi:1-acyl-sn-glycerol-3-phosphate acyltransferase